jgi:hypothetical protein
MIEIKWGDPTKGEDMLRYDEVKQIAQEAGFGEFRGPIEYGASDLWTSEWNHLGQTLTLDYYAAPMPEGDRVLIRVKEGREVFAASNGDIETRHGDTANGIRNALSEYKELCKFEDKLQDYASDHRQELIKYLGATPNEQVVYSLNTETVKTFVQSAQYINPEKQFPALSKSEWNEVTEKAIGSLRDYMEDYYLPDSFEEVIGMAMDDVTREQESER